MLELIHRTLRAMQGGPVISPQRSSLLMVASALLFLFAACEQPTPENIDRWTRTQKGPAKLEKAVRNAELTSELRAHAARNLVRINSGAVVIRALQDMPGDQRQAVIARLVPRLWEDARIKGALTKPLASQINAKDALYEVRLVADDTNRAAIDAYLTEWLTGGYYTGRSQSGRMRGAVIMRAVGSAAAGRLIELVQGVLNAAPDASGARPELEAELLLGLAATGSPDAVGLLLELAAGETRDPRVPRRAFEALYSAFVDNGQRFELADGRALVPHLERLVRIARDDSLRPELNNDAIALIGAAGPPVCLDPLIELMVAPHRHPNFLWVSANAALHCGKAQAIVPVAEALPRDKSYEARKLQGAIWEPMAKLDDTEQVVDQARVLLQSKSWVARIVGVELLGHLRVATSAADDAARLRSLRSDRTVLRGWWGDQRKPPPRLGKRAEEVADELDQLAESSQES